MGDGNTKGLVSLSMLRNFIISYLSTNSLSSAQAAKDCTNVVFLGTSTDGVSKETGNNLKIIIKYLTGEIDWIALLDPNHDNKNTRYQLIGGSGTIPACIGKFVFDPFLLVLASAASGVPHVDLVCYVDYASDKVALDLYSSKVIKSVMDLN